jgi:hypothetical protein
MKAATRDRGAILDFAGMHHLSPGLRDGRPALLPGGEAAGRCGWAPFFEAVERAGLALAWDPEDPGAAGLVPSDEARPHERHATLAEGIDRARRFVEAFRRGPPPAGGG